ncbi:MAG: hypothetical protein JSW61_09945 [Candidatus Thorarchaeota archaeon]|nr:MAG: hypothetical protein JSW61_09945 [Candidatus Thorarchaeota archaeon]
MKQAYGNYRHTRSAVSGLMVWLVLAVLMSTIGTMPVSADVVWSDNFNDGDYDGWTIYGYNFTDVPFPVPSYGNFSAADNNLKATGPVYNYAARPSTVAYGTWSFSLDVVDTPMGYLVIFFVVSNFSQFLTGITGYSLIVHMDGDFNLKRHDGMPPIPTIGSYEYPGDLSGLQEIDVTRNESGLFRVFINGTLRIEVEDSTYTTSEDFCFAAESGPAIDDVVLSDTVDIEPTTTTTTTTGTDANGLPLELIVVVIGGAAVVVILVVVLLRRRSSVS